MKRNLVVSIAAFACLFFSTRAMAIPICVISGRILNQATSWVIDVINPGSTYEGFVILGTGINGGTGTILKKPDGSFIIGWEEIFNTFGVRHAFLEVRQNSDGSFTTSGTQTTLTAGGPTTTGVTITSITCVPPGLP